MSGPVCEEVRCARCDGFVFCTRGDDGPHTLTHAASGSRYCDVNDDPLAAAPVGGSEERER